MESAGGILSSDIKPSDKWYDVISATHGVSLTKEQASAWQMVMKNSLGCVTNKDVCNALLFAVENDLDVEGFRVTAKDVIGWIRKHKAGAVERVLIKDGWLYFPDRPLVCGQMYSRMATEKEILEHEQRKNNRSQKKEDNRTC
jgi:hypothetical protein